MYINSKYIKSHVNHATKAAYLSELKEVSGEATGLPPTAGSGIARTPSLLPLPRPRDPPSPRPRESSSVLSSSISSPPRCCRIALSPCWAWILMFSKKINETTTKYLQNQYLDNALLCFMILFELYSKKNSFTNKIHEIASHALLCLNMELELALVQNTSSMTT